MAKKEAMTLYGSSNGSGIVSVISDWFENEVENLKIDKGLKVKIWVESLDAEGETTLLMESSTDDGGTWREEGKPLYLPEAGHVGAEDMKRPVIVTARTEGTRIRFNADQPAAEDLYISVTVEFERIS